MNNKGFTLIELLAVIVILAIIALIATPIVLNIINDAREEANKRTAELVISTFDSAYASASAFADGGTPTKADIFSRFDMDNITKDNTNYKITSGSVSCEFEAGTDTNVGKERFKCTISGVSDYSKASTYVSVGTTQE